jgi:hypothetical protein
MKTLRTLSTPRLLVLVAVVVLAASLGTAIAVASRGGGPKPAPKALPQAIRDGLAAKAPGGITARITFTNNLFPSGALAGDHASALMTGASGRLWVRSDHRGRVELQSNAGDVQIVWAPHRLSVYDASSNTVYRVALPAHKHGAADREAARGEHAKPSSAQIARALAKLRAHAVVSGATPTDVAGRPAYTVAVGPKPSAGGLLGSVRLAWDALRGVPLRFGIYAKGSSTPVLEVKATDVSYGPVSLADVNLAPPARAKVVTLSRLGGHRAKGPVAVASFTPVAPDSLLGLARTSVRTLGSKAVLVAYGEGPGSILVLERKADAKHQSILGSLPTVSLDGVTGHELATQLGTAVAWERGGIAFVLGASVSSATAENAARALR